MTFCLLNQFLVVAKVVILPISVATRSKAWVFGRLRAEIVGSNPPVAWMLSVVSVVCYQVEVSAME
jgi:hypothetical protein